MTEAPSGRRPHLWLAGGRPRHGLVTAGPGELPPALLRRRFLRWRLLSFGVFRMLRGLAENPDVAEERLCVLAQWQFERLVATASGFLLVSMALLVALGATQFQGGLRVSAVWIALAVVGALATSSFGLLAYGRLRRHGELFAKALEELRRL